MYEFHVIVILSGLGIIFGARNSNVGLNTEQMIKKYEYPFENHTAQTSDGYLLTLHRIPYGVKNNDTSTVRPAVLIMHGIVSSSADFVNLGPEKSISFLLADAGYDVWLGNSRGNTWSRRHISIDPDTESAKFFNFSLHELATLDLPAKIDYILNETQQKSLFYIGHSQGTTILFILLSARPEYNAKIKMAEALAPIGYVKNAKTLIFRILHHRYKLLAEIVSFFNFHEVFPHSPLASSIFALILSNSLIEKLATTFIFAIVGADPTEFDKDFLPVFITNCPAGGSMKQILHLLQIRLTDRFAHFDENFLENVEKSVKTNTPLYNLTQITAPLMFHYSKNDYFTTVEDVKRLSRQISSVKLKLVPLSTFNHLDFIAAINIVKLINSGVIEELNSMR